MNKKSTAYCFLLIMTVIYFFLSHYVALFSHEWTHGTLAWVFGYKSNPFDIYYGVKTWSDLLLFPHIDEAVNYSHICSIGHPYQAGIIAITPPVITNGGMFLICIYLQSKKWLMNKKWLFYFVFWLSIMSLGNVFDYIPVRTFSTHGDIGNFLNAFNISPWWVFVIGTSIVVVFFYHFFKTQVPRVYQIMDIQTVAARTFLLFIILIILPGLFAIPGLGCGSNYTCNAIAWISIAYIPILMIILWPGRQYLHEK